MSLDVEIKMWGYTPLPKIWRGDDSD